MAKKNPHAEKLRVVIQRLKNFLEYTKAFLKKNNPWKLFITSTVTTFKELMNIKTKLKRIRNRINYEKYKLKKTELILAQNSEHTFLRGRSLNQTR